ncbi:MAG: NUDIX domain-containing protein [Cellulomonadaceae bacterium]|nr:NUDIX domain-containing protein [Cellulomonadaceae bacterium]
MAIKRDQDDASQTHRSQNQTAYSTRHAGAWTIPKGEHDPDEDSHAAALREFTEEIGAAPPPGPDVDLGTVRQRAGKTVRAWAREGDLDPATAVRNTFEIEWPPRSGMRAVFPELDRVAWWPIARARELVVAGQVELLDRLAAHLDGMANDQGGAPTGA